MLFEWNQRHLVDRDDESWVNSSHDPMIEMPNDEVISDPVLIDDHNHHALHDLSPDVFNNDEDRAFFEQTRVLNKLEINRFLVLTEGMIVCLQ